MNVDGLKQEHERRLRLMHEALAFHGLLQEFASLMGELRSWKEVEVDGIVCRATTLKRWQASVSHLLDPDHPYRWGDDCQQLAVRLLGFDPTEQTDQAA